MNSCRSVPLDQAIPLALTTGDNYELCFTVPKQKKHELEKKLSAIGCPHTCIGYITKELGIDISQLSKWNAL